MRRKNQEMKKIRRFIRKKGAVNSFEKDYLKKSMNQYFADKGKKNPKNDICFDEGASYVHK